MEHLRPKTFFCNSNQREEPPPLFRSRLESCRGQTPCICGSTHYSSTLATPAALWEAGTIALVATFSNASPLDTSNASLVAARTISHPSYACVCIYSIRGSPCFYQSLKISVVIHDDTITSLMHAYVSMNSTIGNACTHKGNCKVLHVQHTTPVHVYDRSCKAPKTLACSSSIEMSRTHRVQLDHSIPCCTLRAHAPPQYQRLFEISGCPITRISRTTIIRIACAISMLHAAGTLSIMSKYMTNIKAFCA